MRVRFVAPRGSSVRVCYLDSLHAALVNAWTAGGVQGAAVPVCASVVAVANCAAR